jgi:hypothetical protein
MDTVMVRRYGPVVAVVAVLAVVVVVAAVLTSADNDEPAATVTDDGGYSYTTDWGAQVVLPAGVLPFSLASSAQLSVDWPDTCDTTTGRVKMPTVFAAECYAPFTGDNGGATAQGVTADSIRVVLYEAPDDDPVYNAVAGAVTDDPPAATTATYQQYLPMFEQFHETYGRSVELIVYKGSGSAIDEVAARAAATEIANDLKPFAVWGGPLLTPAFEDELSARGVLAMPLATLFDDLPGRDPYMLSVGISPAQTRKHLAEYVGKRLAGNPAEHAGDPQLASQQRRFGLLYLDAGTTGDQEELAGDLAPYGVELAVVASYPSPLGVATQAPGIIARMKDAGVTSVIIAGDPLTPASFTREATSQDYFPEWIIPGSPLTDSTVYARTYDQRQWASAFGISPLVARTAPEESLGGRLFRWYNCSAPPVVSTELVYPVPAAFYLALQSAGPNLTHERFRQALFDAAPTPRGTTYPSLSWGSPDKGRWDFDDFWGSDDVTELWWNATEVGPDETGEVGPGMYAYVDGGRRYLRGEWPNEPTNAFKPQGAVTLLDSTPATDRGPDYPSACAG